MMNKCINRAFPLWLVTLALVSLTTIGGCGGDKSVLLTGTVTSKGQPLGMGTVTFWGGKEPVGATIDSSGIYQVKILPGDYTVTVETTKPAESMTPKDGNKDMPGMGGAGHEAARYIPINLKYKNKETSGLSVKVEKSKQKFDIPLE